MLTTHEMAQARLNITSATSERQAATRTPGCERVRLKRPLDLFAQVDRNLMNYPLARDSRVKASWSKSSKTGRWFCDLPGDKRIRLWLAQGAHARLKRLPSAFDVNVLLLVLARAQIQGDPVVTFPSRAAIFHSLGLSVNRARYRERVDAALELWSAMSIRMPWHPHKKTMPPPIEVTCSKGISLTVTVSVAWRDLGKKKTGYFKQVPLPLPHDAATQNLVLSLLTCVSEEFDGDGEIMRRTSPRNKVNLCRKIGLTHSTSYRAFKRACLEADEWLRKHGGALDSWWRTKDKKVIFIIKNPKVKRSKAQVKKQEEKEFEELERIDRDFDQPERMGRPPRLHQQEEAMRWHELEEAMRWHNDIKPVDPWISIPDDF